jgi:hypothetical protein
MTEQVVTWIEERITTWLPEKGLVHVFRWVPDYAPYGSRRDPNHPTFDEWLEDMRGAAVGLEGAMPSTETSYDTERIGVSGHRPMTDEERGRHAEDLDREIAWKQKARKALGDV